MNEAVTEQASAPHGWRWVDRETTERHTSACGFICGLTRLGVDEIVYWDAEGLGRWCREDHHYSAEEIVVDADVVFAIVDEVRRLRPDDRRRS